MTINYLIHLSSLHDIVLLVKKDLMAKTVSFEIEYLKVADVLRNFFLGIFSLYVTLDS